ncbi:MAG: ATP-binding protein [Bacteroidales bacterium]|nr:ATP-binding protein [Bacteroidales bacterium]
MIKRSQLQLVVSRIKEQRRFMQVLAGPRQVGKTTLVLQLLEEPGIQGFYVAADDISGIGLAWIEMQWETARQRMKLAGTDSYVLIIDEIQKIPNWSETVKRLWDSDSRENIPLHVILLGSSRLLLQTGMTESLAGRYETMYISHWSLAEMREAFGWSADQYAWYGGFPGAASLISDEMRWKNYVRNSLAETSISRDILMMSRVDKPALMRRLFDLGCSYSGQMLSFTKILGQLLDAGNTTTLSHYLDLLDSAGLLGGLEKFSRDTVRKRSSSPKFQVHNTAFVSALHPLDFEMIINEREKWGRIVESAVGAHLINNAYSQGYSLFYWREGNYEVDFVLEHKGRIVALEVKSGHSLRTAGMVQFRKHYPDSKIMLIGKDGIPWEEFLLINPMELF